MTIPVIPVNQGSTFLNYQWVGGGQFKIGLGVPLVNDTGSALNHWPDSLGLVIQVRSTGVWYKRDTIPGVGHFWNVVGAGSGSAGTWGSITGLLSAQTDLMDSLNLRQRILGFQPIAPGDTAGMLSAYIRLAVAQAMFYPLTGNPAGFLTSNGLPFVVNSLQVINGGGVDIWMGGLYASRPAAGTPRRFYFATDSLKIYYDNGSAWQTVAGGGGGGGAAAAWGTITGTLSSQTDLNNALNLRLLATNNLSDLNNAGTARTNIGLGNVANVNQQNATNLNSGQVANNLIDSAHNHPTAYVTQQWRKALADSLGALLGLSATQIALTDTAGIFRTLLRGKVDTNSSYGLHIIPTASRGINPLNGHDSTLVPMTMVDSGGAAVYYVGPDGALVQFVNVPSVPVRNEYKIYITNNHVFDGNSITAGATLSSPSTQAYPVLFGDTLSLTSTVNRAVSNSTVMDLLSRQFANDPATKVSWSYSIMIGENNFGEDTSAIKQNAVPEAINAMIANHFVDSVLPISSSSITKGGTWSNIITSNFVSKSLSKSLGNPMSSSTAGNTLTFIIYDNTLVVGTYGFKNTSSYGSVTISIDGKLQTNPKTLTTTWSGSNRATTFTSQIGTYDARQPIAWVFGNLGFGAHTVVITLLQNAETDFDYIGKLMPPASGAGMIVSHITKRTPAGYFSYSDVGGGPAGIDSMNKSIDTVVNFYRRMGFPIATAKVNEYLNNSLFYTDGLHFLASGHVQLANAFLACVNRSTGGGGGALPLTDTATPSTAGYQSAYSAVKLTHPLYFKWPSHTAAQYTTSYGLGDSTYSKTLQAGAGMSADTTGGTNIKFNAVDTPIILTISQVAGGSWPINKTLYTTDAGKSGPWLYDPTDATTASNGYLCIVDALGHRWKRPLNGNILESTWFGVVADGVTNCTFPFKAIWPFASGYRVHLPDGKMVVDSLPVPQTDNLEVYGQGKVSQIYVTSGNMLAHATGDVNTWWWHDLYFNCDNVHPTFDSGDGLFITYGVHVNGLILDNIWLRNPFSNSVMVGLICQAVSIPGSIKQVYMNKLHADSANQNVIALLNRDTAGSAALFASNVPGYQGPATAIEKTGYDSLKEVYITNCDAANLGLGGTDGTFVTLDGVGYNGRIDNCTVNNAFIIGIENTGFWHWKFSNNWFRNTRHTSYVDFGFSGRPMFYCDVYGNHDVDSMTQPAAFQLLYRSNLWNNVFKGPGKFTNCSWNISTNDLYTGNLTWALKIISTPGNTSVGNTFIHPTIDNSLSTSSPQALVFDGKGVSQNVVRDAVFTPISAGSFTATADTAANTNYVFNPNFGSAVSNSNFTMSLTGRASTISLTNDSDLVDYKGYRFTGSLPQPDTIILTSRIHTNFLVSNGTNQPLFITAPYLGGNGVTVPAAYTSNIFTDSVNIRTTSTTFATTVSTGSTVTLALNSGSTLAFPMAGASAGAITAAEVKTLDSLLNRTITGLGFTNPMTTLGDLLYGGASGAGTRLAGNTAATRLFLISQGTGSAAQVPTLGALASGDIPNNGANTSGTAAGLSGTPALPTGTTVTTSPATGNNSTLVATTANVVLYVASVINSGKFFPTITSSSGPVTSIVVDTMVWTKAGNAVSCAGHFHCFGPTAGTSAVVNITLPQTTHLGSGSLFGNAVCLNFQSGTGSGGSTGSGASNGVCSGLMVSTTPVCQVSWISNGTGSMDMYYTFNFFMQ